MGTRGWYAFLHKGKYYCFYNHWDSYFSGLGYTLVNIIENGGHEMLELLRKLFDFMTNDEKTLSKESSVEWKDIHTKACNHFTGDFFQRFRSMEMEDLDENQERLIGDHIFIEYIYAIDLDNNLFHASEDTNPSSAVFSCPLHAVTKTFLDLCEKMELDEHATVNQSFPLPRSFKEPIINDMASQGYTYKNDMSQSAAAEVYRVQDNVNGQDSVVKVFLQETQSFLATNVSTRTSDKPMALADLILKEPHPNLVSIIKKTTFAGNPALVLKAYDGDFSSLKGRMTLQQKRAALSQVAQGLIYLHKHGVVHHDIKPVNILVNIIDSENVEAVICDFESISIPGARYQPEHHWSELSWGPFAQQDGTKLSQDDRWLCKKWSPTKYTQAFITKNHEEANPWRLDLSSVRIILVKTLIDESWDEQMIIRDESVRFLFDEKVTSVDEAVRDLGTAAHLLTKKGE